MELFRALGNDATKRTGWIHDLLEVDEAMEHTLDVYISARPYDGDFVEWLSADTDLLGPVLLKRADHCMARQRYLKRRAEDEWRSAFTDDEIAQAELDASFAWCHPVA